MSPIPPVPNWSALHPLLTHIPIAMIVLSPVSIISGAVLRGPWAKRCLFISVALLGSGAAMMYVAIHTGLDAVSFHQFSNEMKEVLSEHQEMAGSAASALLLAASLYALTLALRLWLGVNDNRMISTILPAAFLLFYGIGLFQLASAVQHGAQLVHGHAFTTQTSAGGSE